jgi:hypothetical protein
VATSYNDDAYARHQNRFGDDVTAAYDNVELYHRQSVIDGCNRSNYGATPALVPLTVDCGATAPDCGDLPSALPFSRHHATSVAPRDRYENPSICQMMTSSETTQHDAAVGYGRWSPPPTMMPSCGDVRCGRIPPLPAPCESNNTVGDAVSSPESMGSVADSNGAAVVYPWMRRVHLANGILTLSAMYILTYLCVYTLM